jgi:hypothetical protein
MAVHRNIGNYQLCDITEPYLAEAVLNEEWVNDTCDVSYFHPPSDSLQAD